MKLINLNKEVRFLKIKNVDSSSQCPLYMESSSFWQGKDHEQNAESMENFFSQNI